ncbi:MAG TPA: hypothetical protein EYH19_02235 [Desulfocapsa sulfexigens]|nr:hypothetical protein [Desulfocapsa sulfexigens]
MIVQFIDFFRNRMKMTIRLSCGLLVLLVIIDIILGLIGGKHHAHTWVEHYIPGWWSIFGFVSCTLIIFLSKWYGHLGIMTSEDYYDD